MIIRNIYFSPFGIFFLIITLSANVNVKIKIHPKSIKAGDDLTVECLISNVLQSDRLKTFLSCPFKEKKMEHCYADCVSICQHLLCTDKSRFIDTFKCSRETGQYYKRFTYQILSITKEQINNQKILPFSCKYMGLESWENVTATENFEPDKNYYIPKTTTEVSNRLENKDNTIQKATTAVSNTLENKDSFNYGIRDIILIILVFCLLTSFFINIWCCVQWCIWRAKYKKRRQTNQKVTSPDNSHPLTNESDFQMNDFNPEPRNEMMYIPNYDQDEYIRRAKSQPALLNNERNTPVKASTSYLNKMTASMNNNSKYRFPVYSNSINGIYQNGSTTEQMYPYRGQQMFADFQPPYITPYHYMPGQQQFYRMNTSQSEDLNEFTEEDLSENLQSSTNQPLPKKPDDNSLNLELTSSSHIV